jgi:hypothetical protein
LQDLARAHGSAKYGSNGFEEAASGKGVLPEDAFLEHDSSHSSFELCDELRKGKALPPPARS